MSEQTHSSGGPEVAVLDAEDAKLVTLARGARGRAGGAEGASDSAGLTASEIPLVASGATAVT